MLGIFFFKKYSDTNPLRKHARHCEFKTFLDKALRDRLVCGLRSKTIQNRLLTEKDLTLTKALDLAVGMEAAAKEVTEWEAAAGATPLPKDNVFKLNTPTRQSCYCCGKANHRYAQCPLKGLKCHNCGKVGHFKHVCRQPKKPVRAQGKQPPVQMRNAHSVKLVVEASEESDGDVEYYLNRITAKPQPAIKVDLHLQGRPVCMELDTGAPVSLMSWTKFNGLFPDHSLESCSLPMQTYLYQCEGTGSGGGAVAMSSNK